MWYFKPVNVYVLVVYMRFLYKLRLLFQIRREKVCRTSARWPCLIINLALNQTGSSYSMAIDATAAVACATFVAFTCGLNSCTSTEYTKFKFSTKFSTVRDNLFRLCPNLGQHPPFFSKMRTFFKNRPRWLKFYCNSAFNQRGRFLSCIF
jgi:hypothetical protein